MKTFSHKYVIPSLNLVEPFNIFVGIKFSSIGVFPKYLSRFSFPYGSMSFSLLLSSKRLYLFSSRTLLISPIKNLNLD